MQALQIQNNFSCGRQNINTNTFKMWYNSNTNTIVFDPPLTTTKVLPFGGLVYRRETRHSFQQLYPRFIPVCVHVCVYVCMYIHKFVWKNMTGTECETFGFTKPRGAESCRLAAHLSSGKLFDRQVNLVLRNNKKTNKQKKRISRGASRGTLQIRLNSAINNR